MTIRQVGIPGIAGILTGELIVDLFAGGGGASHGIEAALGRSPDIAINHDPHAIQMHEANHPATRHHCQSVHHREVHPTELVRGQRVGLLWLSPDCRHFSRAKGGAPVSKTVRGLAWIGLRWAKFARPRVAVLENVPEFVTWGPIRETHSDGCNGRHPRRTHKDNGEAIDYADGSAYGCKSGCWFGSPIKARAGEHFRAFVREWKRYGYTVEWRTLVAADYGAPTTRKRLFFVARCDGEAISWPEPSHGKSGKPKPWRTAAECIDWSIPCPSIFERKKALAPATCRRIARGIVRYVLQGKPFIVQVAHGEHVARPGDRSTSMDAPIGAVCKTNNHALVAPSFVEIGQRHERGGASADRPMGTIMPTPRQALVAPTLVQTGYGEREGQAPRCLDLHKPLGVCPAAGGKHALVAAFLAKHNGGAVGQPLPEPLHTIAGHINKAAVAAHLTVFRENSSGKPLDEPVPTLTAGGGKGAASMALVAAFLVQYYSQGTQDQPLDEPLATIVTRARHGLVTITVDGTEYAIVDIGMRMLEPHELAAAQGFDPSYVLTGTKSQRIARIGNSVCPPVAAAVVGANLDANPIATKRPAA